MTRKVRVDTKSIRRNYSFSQRTIENLDYLIKIGLARSESEAIDLAVAEIAGSVREREKIKQELIKEVAKPQQNPEPEAQPTPEEVVAKLSSEKTKAQQRPEKIIVETIQKIRKAARGQNPTMPKRVVLE